MTVTVVNFSNLVFEESRLRLNKSAEYFGYNTQSYTEEDIKKSNFFLENRKILEQPIGTGYWLWKPYVILNALINSSEDDIIIYSDSGIEIIEDLQPLISLCYSKESVLLFGNTNNINAHWTKRDCFILMDCDKEVFWNGPHCDASFALFKKNEYSINFIKKWLNYCRDERILTDIANTCGENNISGFVEHRRDQSVLSLLAQKNGIDLYRPASQFGNHYKRYEFRIENEFNVVNQVNRVQVGYYNVIPYYNSFYFQLLNHHRTKLQTDILKTKSFSLKHVVPFLKNQVRNVMKVVISKLGYKLIRK